MIETQILAADVRLDARDDVILVWINGVAAIGEGEPDAVRLSPTGAYIRIWNYDKMTSSVIGRCVVNMSFIMRLSYE